mgnify:CR=1 FL=1
MPVHPNFRVIAIGVPIPPYKGHPLDPPFRSRFQGRWVEGNVGHLGSAQFTVAEQQVAKDVDQREAAEELQRRFYGWSQLLRQHATAASGGGVLASTSQLPNIPGTTLPLIEDLIGRFPPAGMPFEPQEVDSPEINMSDDEKARLARLPPQDGALQVHHTTRAMVSKRELDTLKKITRKSTGESGVANSTRMLLGAAYPALHALDKDKWKLLVELLGGMGLERGLGEQTEVEGVGILGYRALSVERVGGEHFKAAFVPADADETLAAVAADKVAVGTRVHVLAVAASDVADHSPVRQRLQVRLDERPARVPGGREVGGDGVVDVAHVDGLDLGPGQLIQLLTPRCCRLHRRCRCFGLGCCCCCRRRRLSLGLGRRRRPLCSRRPSGHNPLRPL